MHPFEEYDDLVYKKFQFHWQFIFWTGWTSVKGHWILFAEKRVFNTRLASVSGSVFLHNWKLPKRSGSTDRCWSVNSILYHHYGDWCTDAACMGLDQAANAGSSKSPKANILCHESDSKSHWIHWWHPHSHPRPKPTGIWIHQPEELSFNKCSGKAILLHNTICVQSWFETPLK